MSERRRATRKPIGDRLVVTDAMTGEEIGVIGNLSHDGLLLILKRPMPPDTLFQVAFHIPDGRGNDLVEVGLHEQWTEKSDASGLIWAGFRIIDMAPEERERLIAFVGD